MSKSASREKEVVEDSRKVFITNIDGAQAEQAVQSELRRLFERFGVISKLNVKKNKNGLYSFAFLQFESGEAAGAAIKELDQYQLFGKRMRVYYSHRSRRQDRQSEGCFHCKRPGHFAKECPENRDYQRQEPREYRHHHRQEERYDRRDERHDHRYDDRYRPHHRDHERRDREYYPRRRSPSRSPSHSRSYRRHRDYSSESDRRYPQRRYYNPRERSDRRREDVRGGRRRDSSYSRSRSSGR